MKEQLEVFLMVAFMMIPAVLVIVIDVLFGIDNLLLFIVAAELLWAGVILFAGGKTSKHL